MRIDSHQHFWTLARGDYSWLTPELTPIYRDFGPGDLAPLLARHNIERTVLVQAAPTVAETLYMLDVALRTPFVAGVVGWADFEAKDAPKAIAGLASNRLLLGLRPMVYNIADDDWLTRSDLAPAFAAMKSHRLAFDALVQPRHLPRLLTLIETHPDLMVVVDHAGKPFIRERKLDPWRADMAAIAGHPLVVCKMSGLATEAAANWNVDDLKPYVAHLLETFGPHRLLWGSDWPVVDRAGGYDRWREATMTLLRDLDENDREAVFGGNAARVYLSHRGRS